MRLRLRYPAFLSLLLSLLPAARTGAAEHFAWSPSDSLQAAAVIDCLAHRPASIDSLIAGSLMRDHVLGFGRRLREAWINPAGALGFSLKVVYEGVRPISYEAKPILNYGGLRARYLALLGPDFGARPGRDRNVIADPYVWNLAAAAEPLPRDSLRLAPGPALPAGVAKVLEYYMTPYSGILYGIRGGHVGQMLENRDRFLGLAEILMADKRLALYLIRSINPATRLTAAEFILRHKENFPALDSLQRTAFRAAFSNPPLAATLRGGRETFENPRRLVFEFAREEIRRDGRGVLRMY